MGRVHGFEEANVAELRERLGATEQERDHLLAFARGHSGAVASIHRAVLAVLEADPADRINVVSRRWPSILGIDSTALLLVDDDEAVLWSGAGCHPLDRKLATNTLRSVGALVMRSVERGHVLFGAACENVRAEALIRLELPCGGQGLLLLGQRASLPVDPRRGGDLLLFLGRSLAAMMAEWKSAPSN
jgi:uncharacterized protein YigA (DUF484 family)